MNRNDRRDKETGRFTPKMSDQDILKVFDYSDDTMLTTDEIATGLREHFEIDVTAEAVRQRLNTLEKREIVARKDFGARAVGWRALEAPGLSDESTGRVQESEADFEEGNAVALEDADV